MIYLGLSDSIHILSLGFLDVCVNVEGVAVSLSLQWGRCVNFAVFLKGTDVTWDRLLTFIEPKFPQY